MQNYTYKNFTIHHFAEIQSTNSYAFELARSGKIFDHEIIVAESQKSGRGRKDRKWESPQGNLYFSLVLQPKIALEKISQISFLAIVALRLTIEKIAPQNSVKNKWPNDLLIDEKKLAGILLESEIQKNEAHFVIVGIGVNIVSNPENTIFPASNLKNFGIEVSPQNLLKNFLDEFENLYQNWLNYGFTGIRTLWLAKAFRLKEKISVKLDEETIEGIFTDLDLEGNLLLKSGEKTLKILTADIL